MKANAPFLERLARVQRLAAALRAGGFDLHAFAEAEGLAERHVRREIALLRVLGWRIAYNARAHAWEAQEPAERVSI